MRILLFILLFSSLNPAFSQTRKKQILVIGTFHFRNPGLDVAKVNTFNVMSDKSQQELESISNSIAKFAPAKIFVEWDYSKQDKLDNLYRKNVDSLMRKDANELVQIALRSAKKLKHPKLYGVDYKKTSFPYDSLITQMKIADQLDLIEEGAAKMKVYESLQNKKLTTLSLKELLLDFNTRQSDNFSMQWYFGTASRGGKQDNFAGAFLVSEWYKRNLYMYSLIQKLTEAKDNKIMVILGAGHIAMLREFIKFDPEFEILELKDIL